MKFGKKILLPYEGEGAVMTCPECLCDGIIYSCMPDNYICWNCNTKIPKREARYIEENKK